MSLGEALAEARSRAGLSIDELSERTRIRKAVIQSIEHDEFDACGGDLFVRGYVRALAGAVGLDARPLIREYNRAHADTGDAQVAHVARIADQVLPVADPAVTAADIPAVGAGPDPVPAGPGPASPEPASPGPASPAQTRPTRANPMPSPDMTVADLPVVSEDPSPTVDDLPVVPGDPPPHPHLPGTWVAESPGRPARPRRPPGTTRGRRGSARIAVFAALVLIVAGVATGLALSSQPGPPAKNAASIARPSKSSTPASPAAAAPKKAATSKPKASRPAKAAPVTSLHIARAEAFGPNGLADGDNPQGAMSVIGHGSGSPWQSQWYATAAFGNLKKGTGLLIDMGHPVTVANVRIDMAGHRGANLELRVGDSASGPSSMRIAARASGVGGAVQLRLRSPQHVRYVLIWFTQLPPNGSGTYQAIVYHVRVNGH